MNHSFRILRELWDILAVRIAAIISASVLLSFFLLPGVRRGLLSRDFLPHATCYLQDPGLILLHAGSDALIGLAYLAISANIGYLVYRARADIPFHWMFMAFGLFIVACGFTHVMAVVTVWHPVYWLSADVKVITAAASLTTAVALPFLMPKVFTLIHSAKLSEERKRNLEEANVELRELYEKVKEIDELKSQFFANVSHELRTPLTLIIGPAEQLQESGRLDPEQLDRVQTIRRNSALLLHQVNNVLEASRLEAHEVNITYQEIDLAALVRLSGSHFATLGDERKIDFSIDAPESLMAEADAEKLQRVLLNLFGNAFKFVPNGGSIQCRLEDRGDRCRIIVQDNGPGIPPQMRDAVFERFRQVEGGSTRRFGGTGLGLSIARDFVVLHHGTIHAEESPGGGATFIIELPLRAPEDAEVVRETNTDSQPAPSADVLRGVGGITAPTRPAAPFKPTGRPRVLIVEDDPDMNRFLTGILAENYDVISAFNGREGFEKAREHEPDLILSDIMMPEMSGDQLIPLLRRENSLRDTPMILLSAKADEELRLDLLKKGATDYLLKPFSIQEVKAKVANFIALSLARRLLQDDLDTREGDVAKLATKTIDRKRELAKALDDQAKAEERLQILNLELEKRVAQRTRELEAANQELESFTSTATHDLRAPLRTIAGMADILAEDFQSELGPEARDYLERIRNSAKRMNTLIQDLFEYSRVGRAGAELGPVSLETLLRNAHDSLGGEIGARHATIELPATQISVLAHETLLSLVISNLLSNAIKYVAPDTRPMVKVEIEDRGDAIRLLVRDNGIGIAPDDHQRIFELFKRLHTASDYPGSGLGLAILAKSMDRMNGRFGVESTPGKGSTFWVELKKAD